MPRKKSDSPDAKLEYSAGCWRVYWRWDGDKYSASTGYTAKSERKKADPVRRSVANELAKDNPVFPPEIATSRAATRYVEKRYGAEKKAPAAPPADWLGEYVGNIRNSVVDKWADDSIATLLRLEGFVNGRGLPATAREAKKMIADIMLDGCLPARIDKTTPTIAHAFLDAMIASGVTPARRNRALAICSRFFKWAVRTKRSGENPFAGIGRITEERPGEITYCTRDERARILATARTTGAKDWLAVPIAFYAGCRRGEIFTSIRWEDVNFDNTRITVRKTKKKRPRTLPMAAELVAVLMEHRRGSGPVVMINQGETWGNQADRMLEMIREQLCPPENPGKDGRPREATGKRTFLMTADEVHEWKAERNAEKAEGAPPCPGRDVAWDGGEWLPAERVGWTAFRHTFGSLLAQKSVGLDKISAWMGNTPEVCRRHYAQFVPRDKHDEDIDKL